MRTCMIADGNILFLFLFHYSFLSAISSLLHAVNKVILAAFIVG
ncbi:succinate dehydrogenase [Klebsiella pneumoniae]|nr:succinate dehydrogenase [Klebsiella pneumoniae]HBT9256747.1 succinate dehydrogenase [Klebsiella pneumoniae]HBT9404673.1 succinate dehydrogenase [Klebsiella pneumoniae]HBT9570239.1 succinate dehydrogenase [Klebsiella pneumoniae]